MTTVKHQYENCLIEIKFYARGREEIFIDGQLVSKTRNISMYSSHSFIVDGKSLKVRVQVISLLDGKVAVSIYEGERIIYCARHEINSVVHSLFEDKVDETFSEEELRWQKEIEFPNDIFGLVWPFYFSVFAASAITPFDESSVFRNLSIFVLISFVGFAFFKILISIYRGLFNSGKVTDQ